MIPTKNNRQEEDHQHQHRLRLHQTESSITSSSSYSHSNILDISNDLIRSRNSRLLTDHQNHQLYSTDYNHPSKIQPEDSAHNRYNLNSDNPKLRTFDHYRSRFKCLNRLGGGLEFIGHHHPLEPLLIIFITLLAGLVRCWKISRPASVVFDEVHFGGFASRYIRAAFFMDVHPPLIKLLLALVAWVSGYDGQFDFKEIGSDYPSDQVPYVQMRLLPAILGVAVVPLTYLTLRMLSLRPQSASLGAILVTFDNGLIVQSRFILVDSPLLFFTALSIFFHVGFCNEDIKSSFTRRWWGWLLLTGLSLGAAVSSKWIGLFTIATIGLVTIKQLWEQLGDLRIPISHLMKSFIARLVCLAIIPSMVYIFVFRIHLWVLTESGEGDAFMSSEFQQTLRGHGMPDTFSDVLIGSNVTIRHINTLGGYLHSHAQYYPAGSRQQQITLYPHQDDNNVWTIQGRLSDDVDIHHRKHPQHYYQNRVSVNTSTFIRLRHAQTHMHLHSHDIRAPVTEVDYQNEVSGYGFPNFPGDANDEWIIEIVSKESDVTADPISAKRLRAIRTKFRLRHTLQNCYLFSHKVRLPDWGFGQQEVTCNRNPTLASSLWYIETNVHPLLIKDKSAEKVNYKRPGFFARFRELQLVMWQSNKALVQHHSYGSRPSSWPTLKRGMNFWVKDHRQVYLLGNPFIWWLGTASIAACLSLKLMLILRVKLGHRGEARNPNVVKYDRLLGYLLVGWGTHYIPFFLMDRQLFLHHYFPSFYFSVLTSSTLFDFSTKRMSLKSKWKALVLVLFMAIWTWWVFSPITYASQWTRAGCEQARWRRTWDFSCLDFPEATSDYEDEDAIDPNFELVDHTTRIRGGSRMTNYNRLKILEPIKNVFQSMPFGQLPGESLSNVKSSAPAAATDVVNLTRVSATNLSARDDS